MALLLHMAASLNMLLAIWEESTLFLVSVRDTQQSTGDTLDRNVLSCFFSFDVYLLYLYKGREQFFSRSIKVRVLLIIIMAINSIICMAMPKAAHFKDIKAFYTY